MTRSERRRTLAVADMLRSILVPLDGSPLAERALACATALSIPTGARLVLMRAVMAHTLLGADARAPQTAALDEAAEYLAHTAAGLTQRGFECETATPYGSPGEWLPQEATLRHTDLIAMSTHGRTGPGRWLFGSVAESVVASSPVPVLIERAWHPARREPFLAQVPRIVVPLDGSPLSESALGPAARLAEDLGAELTLLRVEAWPTDVLTDDNGLTVAYLDRQEEWSKVSALDYLERLTSALEMQNLEIPVRTQVLMGNAADGIVEASEKLGFALVCMATHGRTGIRRTILGSIAGKVLEGGTAPLILVGPSVVLGHSQNSGLDLDLGVGEPVVGPVPRAAERLDQGQ